MSQLSLFEDRPLEPAGLRYWPDVLDEAQAQDLVEAMAGFSFAPFDFHGFEANRRVASFGWRYDFKGEVLVAADPIPKVLQPLRARIAELTAIGAEAFTQALVTQYAAGAGIGWHKDKRVFGLVAGVSLAAPCVLRFRRRTATGFERRSSPLAPNSAYLLSGEARSDWEHSIAPMDRLRYSITFRTLRPQALPAR